MCLTILQYDVSEYFFSENSYIFCCIFTKIYSPFNDLTLASFFNIYTRSKWYISNIYM